MKLLKCDLGLRKVDRIAGAIEIICSRDDSYSLTSRIIYRAVATLESNPATCVFDAFDRNKGMSHRGCIEHILQKDTGRGFAIRNEDFDFADSCYRECSSIHSKNLVWRNGFKFDELVTVRRHV